MADYNLFSIVSGSAACDAGCGFCVSAMTYNQGLTYKKEEVNWQNFHMAAQLAEIGKASTVMITGKGEPTLFPQQITDYLEALKTYRLPLKELQTNGMNLNMEQEKYAPYLKSWYDLGLRTIAVSVVHYEGAMNKQVYLPHRKIEYPSLVGLIENLHENGYNVRLANIMLKGFIDSPESIDGLIGFAKQNGVEQLTVRPVNTPSQTENGEMVSWISPRALDKDQKIKIRDHLRQKGTLIKSLSYGAEIYDIAGQNVCMTNSLTMDPSSEQIRQLIFIPPGTITEDWVYKAATLISVPGGKK